MRAVQPDPGGHRQSAPDGVEPDLPSARHRPVRRGGPATSRRVAHTVFGIGFCYALDSKRVPSWRFWLCIS
jgi:hypothetical protein